jgi:hypothetical protein
MGEPILLVTGTSGLLGHTVLRLAADGYRRFDVEAWGPLDFGTLNAAPGEGRWGLRWTTRW